MNFSIVFAEVPLDGPEAGIWTIGAAGPFTLLDFAERSLVLDRCLRVGCSIFVSGGAASG